MQYDYLIVGAGLFGATFAHEANKRKKKCLVIDKRKHIAGNAYTENINGINIHIYGAHIFHTNNKEVWEYVNQFSLFNHYRNSPIANYNNELYNLPFNMNTFYKLWGAKTPIEAKKIIQSQRKKYLNKFPLNLEEQALSLVGNDIYNKLINGYTEKQWGSPCNELPIDIITRIPLRFNFDNNYYNDIYQGIPIGGYTNMVKNMLDGIEVILNTDFISFINDNNKIANTIIYTGMIDEFFNYKLGALEYRSLKFETKILPIDNYQGNAVINYTSKDIPYTRIIEHKHFEFGEQDTTVITYEYPIKWEKGLEPYYPINTQLNNEIYKKYTLLAAERKNLYFEGRLGKYCYLDMDKVILSALDLAKKLM